MPRCQQTSGKTSGLVRHTTKLEHTLRHAPDGWVVARNRTHVPVLLDEDAEHDAVGLRGGPEAEAAQTLRGAEGFQVGGHLFAVLLAGARRREPPLHLKQKTKHTWRGTNLGRVT